MGIVQCAQHEFGRRVLLDKAAEIREALGVQRIGKLDKSQISVNTCVGSIAVRVMGIKDDPTTCHVIRSRRDGLGRSVDDIARCLGCIIGTQHKGNLA